MFATTKTTRTLTQYLTKFSSAIRLQVCGLCVGAIYYARRCNRYRRYAGRQSRYYAYAAIINKKRMAIFRRHYKCWHTRGRNQVFQRKNCCAKCGCMLLLYYIQVHFSYFSKKYGKQLYMCLEGNMCEHLIVFIFESALSIYIAFNTLFQCLKFVFYFFLFLFFCSHSALIAKHAWKNVKKH